MVVSHVSTFILQLHLAGGLSKPYKGFMQTKPLKGPERYADCIAFTGRPLRGSFYALVFLLPVNGSTNSLRLIWSAIWSSCN